MLGFGNGAWAASCRKGNRLRMSNRANDNETRRQRYRQALEVFGQRPTDPAFQLMVAICLTQLGDYGSAEHLYRLSLVGVLEDRWWQFTGIMHGLVDTYLLANQPELLPLLSAEVEAYKQDRRGSSLEALYAYSIACLLSFRNEEALGQVDLCGRKGYSGPHRAGSARLRSRP
jgi:hypothetical protein